MRQAARRRPVVQCSESGFRHGTPPIDSRSPICHGILHCSASYSGLASWRERRALAAINAVRGVDGAERGGVGVGAAIGVARGETRGIGTDTQAVLTAGTRSHC